MKMTNKKGLSTGMWVLIIAIIIVIVLVVYLGLSGGDISSIIPSTSSILQPPALPSG